MPNNKFSPEELKRINDDFDSLPDAVDSKNSSLMDSVKSKAKGAVDYLSKQKKDINETASDFGTGVQQGATMGFSDEIGAGIQALLAKVSGKTAHDQELIDQGFTGDLQPDMTSIYKEAQAKNQADVLNAQERSPVASFTGELAGGLASAIPTAGFGASAAGSKVALRELLKNSGKMAAAKELVKRAGGAAIANAPLGALYGAGSSQEGKLIGATPEERAKLGGDTLKGAAIASATGAGISLAKDLGPIAIDKAGDLAKYSLDKFKGTDVGRQMGRAFDIGKEGLDDVRLSPETGKPQGGKLYGISDADSSANILKMQENTANDLTKDVFGADKQISKNVGRVIQDASDGGVLVNPDASGMKSISDLGTFLDNRPAIMGSDETNKVVEAVSRFNTGRMTPMEAQELKLNLGNMIDSLDPMSDDYKIVNRAYESLNNTLRESVPGYNEANKLMSDYRGNVTESVLSKGKDAEFRKGFQSDKAFPKADFQSEILSIVKELNAPGTQADKKKEIFSKFIEKMDEFERSQPGILKSLGLNKDEIINKVSDVADISNVRKQMLGYEPSKSGVKGTFEQVADVFNPKSQGYRLSNYAGRASRVGKNGLDKVSQTLFHQPEEMLMQHAQQLKSGKLPFLGDSLEKAIQNKDQTAKNAALFAIMQNPKARQELGMTTDDFDENR